MQKTHPLDRLADRIGPAVLIGSVVSVPITLLSYGWMLKDFLYAYPWWIGLVVVIAHFFSLLSLAFLAENRKLPPTSTAPDQSAQPRRS